MGKTRKVKAKGKKKHKPSISSKKYEFYVDNKKTKRECPKCGPGVFMAEHKDRFHCGKCGYCEFKKNSGA